MKVRIKNQTVEYTSDYTPTSAQWKRQAGPPFRIAEVGGVSCFIKRFLAEPPGAPLLLALREQFRPFTPQIYDYVETREDAQTVRYLFTEALDGRTLEESLAAAEPVALERLTEDVLTAFAALHENGFYMADFCEKNIFVSGGRYYLIDLDSAQPSGALPSSAPNTPGYIPSQELAAQALFFYRDVLARPNFQLRDFTGPQLDLLRLALLTARLYFAGAENIPYLRYRATATDLPARLDAAAPYARALFIAAANQKAVPDGVRTLLYAMTKPAASQPKFVAVSISKIDVNWWETLDDLWREIFIEHIKAQPVTPDFFQKIENLTELNCSETGVNSLEPLSGLINLTKIKCYNNQIVSLAPLAKLVNLKTLGCAYNLIPSLEPLKSLKNLTKIGCGNNAIESLEPLARLTNLTYLNCYNNLIQTLEPLRELVNLKKLIFSHNPVESLEPLSGLNVLSYVYFNHCGVSSLLPLHRLPNLKKFGCAGTEVADAEIRALSRRLYLIASPPIQKGAKKTRAIPSNPKINTKWWEELDDTWHKIFIKNVKQKPETPDFFEKISNLTQFYCQESQIESLEPLRELTKLKELGCWFNQIESLEPLRNLTKLTTLRCGKNAITSLEPLRGLKNLRTLDCWGNWISSLAPLRGLNGLRELDCSNCPIPFAEIEKLKKSLPHLEIER